jgi:hypothetical protein
VRYKLCRLMSVVMANNNNLNVRYVYHLPYFARRELCRILDRMDKWEELGKKSANLFRTCCILDVIRRRKN